MLEIGFEECDLQVQGRTVKADVVGGALCDAVDDARIEVMLGALAKANRRVVEFKESSFGRPGYGPDVPPQEGCWQASSGMGRIPWKIPAPPRSTTLYFPPKL